MDPTFDIDGLDLDAVAPETPEALAQVVRACRASGQPLYWVGGGLSLGAGIPATVPGTVVHMTSLDRVIDYPARDMTITAQAGIRVSRLQEILARERQTLPLDIPWPDKATLGGVLACNVSGSRRLAHGTPRDFVIGLTVVDDNGKLTRSGGRVVKNVAGYDMAKLHVGAHGTLGPMAQVTLKVRPLPPVRAWLAIPLKAGMHEAAADRAHGCAARPVAFDLLALPGGPAAWTAMIGFEGEAPAVAWQVARAKEEFRDLAHVQIIECQPNSVDAMATRLAERTDPQSGAVAALGCLPSRTAGLAARVLADMPGAVVHALPGSGVVRAVVPEGKDPRGLLPGWRDAAGPGGWARLARAPRPWRQADSMWGPARPEEAISAAIAGEMDPDRIFNPNRMRHNTRLPDGKPS
jgi:glycolate oxidase FAD binding subunit